jgi:hypothetical protein
LKSFTNVVSSILALSTKNPSWISASEVRLKDSLASVSFDSLSLTISVFKDNAHLIESHASYLVSTSNLFSI